MKRLLLVAAVSIPALAFTYGGWAITTVENVPEFAVTQKPFEIAYTVRQHGTTLLAKLGGTVTITGGDVTRNFPVLEIGEGMYKSQVTIPASGEWNVQIFNGFGRGSGTSFTIKARGSLDATPSPMLPYDRGKQLYVTKGCAGCHSHELTKDIQAANIGPDLSEPKYANAYLARFLANPAIKTDWKGQWRMPNLSLKPDEIRALIAFLNQDKSR
jgi:mono/diheme cytochrome c family protein